VSPEEAIKKAVVACLKTAEIQGIHVSRNKKIPRSKNWHHPCSCKLPNPDFSRRKSL
jgi:hypothetical protein